VKETLGVGGFEAAQGFHATYLRSWNAMHSQSDQADHESHIMIKVVVTSQYKSLQGRAKSGWEERNEVRSTTFKRCRHSHHDRIIANLKEDGNAGAHNYQTMITKHSEKKRRD
jgi:hypothetical protein